MYTVTDNGNITQSSVVGLVVDTLEEITELPTTFGVGSTCICLEDSSVRMLGNDKHWHEL